MELDNIKTAIDAGAASALPILSHGGIPYVAVPESYEVKSLESLLPAPARKRAVVKVTDTDSFIFYTKKHGSLDNCTIYADIDAEASHFNLIGIINDHGADVADASWRDHRCSFNPKRAVEWDRWLSKDGKIFSQVDFATWLEDNLADILTTEGMPSGSDILQMALGFEAHSDKKFRSKVNLQSGGVQFEFCEEEKPDTRSTMQVFQRFTLKLPVFDGSTSVYPLEARLKYREQGGKLNFWYELIRPDRVFKSAVSDELTAIKDATGFPLLHGNPGV